MSDTYRGAEIVRRVTEALLSKSDEVRQAWAHDAEFHALLTTKVNLLVSELDSMAVAADVRMNGHEVAVARRATEAYGMTSPSAP